MSQAPIKEEFLIADGWIREYFVYEVYGGEDEDGRDIFVKDNIAVTEIGTGWYRASYDDLNYEDGFADENRVRYMEDLNTQTTKDESPPDNQVFVVDLDPVKFKLTSLEGTAGFLPVEYLESWLKGFIENEQFEEAAIIKKELEERK